MMKIEKWFVNSEKHARSNIKILEDLLNYFVLGNISRVLEIGCGTGTLSAYLVNKDDLSLAGTDVDIGSSRISGEGFLAFVGPT